MTGRSRNHQVRSFTSVPNEVMPPRIAGMNLQLLGAYVLLKSYCFHGGPVFPAIQTLAERAGVSSRTMQRLLKGLENLGLIRRRRRRRSSYVYRFQDLTRMSGLASQERTPVTAQETFDLTGEDAQPDKRREVDRTPVFTEEGIEEDQEERRMKDVLASATSKQAAGANLTTEEALALERENRKIRDRNYQKAHPLSRWKAPEKEP